jgi:hypothetical protein
VPPPEVSALSKGPVGPASQTAIAPAHQARGSNESRLDLAVVAVDFGRQGEGVDEPADREQAPGEEEDDAPAEVTQVEAVTTQWAEESPENVGDD